MKFEHKLIIDNSIHLGRIKENKEIYNKYYKDKFSSVSEFIYCYLHQDTFEKDSVCPVCGNKINFDNKNCKYPKHCSRRCTQLDKKVREKYNRTCLRKYGKVWYTQTKEYSNKYKQTCLSKYGKEYYAQTQECKDKYKQTCLDKYGVSSYTKSSDYKYKAKLKLDTTIQKGKQTKLSLDSSGLNSYQRAVLKGKQTCLEKYGVDSYTKTKEFKQRVLAMKQKEYVTKRLNNSFNTSKQEEKVYKLLLTKFNETDIKRQFTSVKYPFACDFYIESLDLYIECNFHWTHYTEPFDNMNPKHLKLLKDWELKKSKFYNIAMKVWSYKDPLKVRTAKKNNIKLLVFYKLEDFEIWFKAVKDSNGDYVLAVKSVK